MGRRRPHRVPQPRYFKKPKPWSPKVNDPRQIDLLDSICERKKAEGFALLDEALKKAREEDA